VTSCENDRRASNRIKATTSYSSLDLGTEVLRQQLLKLVQIVEINQLGRVNFAEWDAVITHHSPSTIPDGPFIVHIALPLTSSNQQLDRKKVLYPIARQLYPVEFDISYRLRGPKVNGLERGFPEKCASEITSRIIKVKLEVSAVSVAATPSDALLMVDPVNADQSPKPALSTPSKVIDARDDARPGTITWELLHARSIYPRRGLRSSFRARGCVERRTDMLVRRERTPERAARGFVRIVSCFGVRVRVTGLR